MGSPGVAPSPDQQRPAAVTTSRRHRPAADANPTGRRLSMLSVTPLGVVYGDIRTSPLYAFRACFSPEYGLPRTAATVYSVLKTVQMRGRARRPHARPTLCTLSVGPRAPYLR